MNTIRTYISVHKSSIVDYVILFMLGLLAVSWFRNDLLISTGDFLYPLSRSERSYQELWVWDSAALGELSSRLLPEVVPFGFFLRVSEILSVPLVTSEKIWFYLWFTFSGISMHFLVSSLLKGRGHRIAALTSASFYMLNQYVAMNLPSIVLDLPYAFTPMIMALYIKGIDERRPIIRSVILLSLFLTITVTSAFINPLSCAIIWGMLFAYLILRSLFSSRKKMPDQLQAFKFTVAFFLAWIVLNAFWIIPLTYFFQQEVSRGSLLVVGLSDVQKFTLNSVPLFDSIRLTGSWALTSGYQGDPYFLWGHIYSSTAFQIISFLIPFLAFFPLVTRGRNKHVQYFSIMAILGLLILTGSYPPLGVITVRLLNVFPFMATILRDQHLWVGKIVVLCYSFLIGVGLADIYHIIDCASLPIVKSGKYLSHIVQIRIKYTSIAVIIFLLLGLYAWPFWTGEVIYQGGKVIPSAYCKAPDYYHEASNWLSPQSEVFRIFSFPTSKLYYSAYWWNNGSHGYVGGDPSVWLLNKPVITSTQSGHGLSESIAESIAENSAKNIAKVLALMNVKYVLFHADTNWEYLEGHPWWISISPESFRATLNFQKDLSLEKSFGELDFYRNEYWRPMQIYATSNAQLVEGGSDEMIRFIERDDFTPGKSVLFLSDQLDAQQISALPWTNSLHSNSTDNISVTYEKINPTLYNIQINASKPFFLVFSESYHKDWTAYIDGKQIPSEYHCMANAFANSWYINKTGSFTVTLEFWPQRLFYIGATVSITTLILCTIYITKDKVKTIYKQYVKKNIPQDLQRQSDDTPTTPEDLKVQQKEDPSSV